MTSNAGRRPPRAAQVAGILAFVVLGACSLTVDLTPLNDGVCPAGYKPCDERCVSIKATTFGCASASCAPCALSNAQSVCSSSGVCAIASCIGAHQDCDGVADTGCEIDINHDPKHCGSCDAEPCSIENGVPGCSGGVCATGGCKAGFGDCNHNPSDGCEADVTSDPKNCGSCQSPCAADKTCVESECM